MHALGTFGPSRPIIMKTDGTTKKCGDIFFKTINKTNYINKAHEYCLSHSVGSQEF